MSEVPLVVHVLHHLVVGGMENGVVNLINQMPPDQYRHCVVCVEDFSTFRDRITRDGVAVHALNKSKLSTVELYATLYELLKQLQPEIVHSRNLSGLDALVPACLAKIPVRIHGEHGWDVHDLHGTRLKPRLLRRLHSPMVHRYITVSRDLRSYLVNRVGVSSSRISQIYNGVDVDKFVPAAGKPVGIMPPDFGGAQKIVIGTVGRLQAVKDHVSLLKALSLLVSAEPRLRSLVRLAIIGDGPMRRELTERITAEGLQELVWMSGSSTDVRKFYQCFDLFVLSSLNEGISNTILEAMATGLPIIATRVGGNGELIDDTLGSLVPASSPQRIAEAMRRYIDDECLRRQHGKAARQRAVREFSIDAMVRAYGEVYDNVRAQRGKGRR